MPHLRWKLNEFPWRVKQKLVYYKSWIRMFHQTFFYNEFTSFSVALETVFEPLFCFVDRFAKYMGPVSGYYFLDPWISGHSNIVR